MYKLIAVDMDGTLLNEDKKITKHTKDVISQAKKIGKKVVLSTGRPLKGVRRYVEELNLLDEDDYVITFNGALVQSTKDENIILDIPLSYEDYAELYKVSQELGVNIHALTDKSVLTPKNNEYTQIEIRINQIPLIESPVEEVEPDTLIVKVMFIDKPELLDQAFANLPQWVLDKYTIVRSTPYFLEFLDLRVNKGIGVSAVAEKLGLTKEEVICVGDAENDLAMIEYAGLGVAMGNATEQIKKVADYITRSNAEEGVAHVIEKFML